MPSPRGPAPAVQDRPDSINVKGAAFELVFSRQTGLIKLGEWSMKGISAAQEATS